MSDIIERLRRAPCDVGGDHPDLHEQAADEIERLRAVLERIERTILGTPDQFKAIAREALRDD